jgi:hypothetical protein
LWNDRLRSKVLPAPQPGKRRPLLGMRTGRDRPPDSAVHVPALPPAASAASSSPATEAAPASLDAAKRTRLLLGALGHAGLGDLSERELLELSSGAEELVDVLRGLGARVLRASAVEAAGPLGLERFDAAFVSDGRDGPAEPFAEIRRLLKRGGVVLVHDRSGGSLSLPTSVSVRRRLRRTGFVEIRDFSEFVIATRPGGSPD